MKLEEIAKVPRVIEGDVRVPEENVRLEYEGVIVKGNFDCSNTDIMSLKGSPIEVMGNFSCMDTGITSLYGGPRKVGGVYICSHTDISSFKGIASSVGNVLADRTNLTSLKGVHKYIRVMHDPSTRTLGNMGSPSIEIDSAVNESILGVMLIKGFRTLIFDHMAYNNDELHAATMVINRGIRARKSIHIVQEELIESGLERFAKV